MALNAVFSGNTFCYLASLFVIFLGGVLRFKIECIVILSNMQQGKDIVFFPCFRLHNIRTDTIKKQQTSTKTVKWNE